MDDAVKTAFATALEDKGTFGFLQIGIDDATQKFTLLKSERGAEHASDWSAIAPLCEKKSHTFIVVMDTSEKGALSGLCVLMHWGPDESPVRDRMLYASSRATLKAFLGTSNFSTPDYYASVPADLSVEAFLKQRSMHLDIDFRSEEEREKEAASLEATAKSTSTSIMQRLPVEFTDSAKEAIEAFKAGSAKFVVISLSGDALEIVNGEVHADSSLDYITSVLKSEPCYLMFWHTRVRGEEDGDPTGEELTKSVFGFYCPDDAKRMEKFTYSTCKVNITDFCQDIGLFFAGKVEFTSTKDFAPDNMDYHLFPIKESTEKHAKPSAPGGGKRKKRAKIDI
jgi:twinfilin-like protein